jgi:YHS domain-containing protein
MQIRYRTLTTVLLAGLFFPSTAFPQKTVGPNQWLVDYSFARQEAKRLGLPLLIHFSATWCGPCKQMERDTLHAPALQAVLGTQVIALKVDSDENPGLIDAFRVELLPTDIVVAPDGKIVSRTTNYQNPDQYLANIRHWSKQFPQERAEAIARLTPPPKISPPASGSTESIPPGAPVIAGPQRPIVGSTVDRNPKPSPAPAPAQLVGLSGYSPVAIKTRRVWVKGREDLSVTWQGVIYYLSNDHEYMAFKNAPHRYAPRMLGCDPVLLWNSDRAVQGLVEFGAFYDGDLYLFTTGETRDRFKVNPNQFVNVRHVLNPEEVVGTRIR